MLGKEDVLLWFKDLESYKRIDVMYELLNMCMPFEVRFLGSCIEEIGKHTFQELRAPSIAANNVEQLSKDPSLQMDLAEESTRHRAVIYMSMLSARNYVGASWYFRTLFRTTDPIEHVLKMTGSREECQNVVSELLLLYTLGLHHPAFTFEQKTVFSNALKRLQMYSMCGNHVPDAGKPQVRNLSSQNDVPMKAASAMPGGDSLPMQHHPTSQNTFVARTPFPSSGTVVGAPEVRPFPAQSTTPQASSPSTPPPSLRRASSPLTPIRPRLPTAVSQPSLLPLALQEIDTTSDSNYAAVQAFISPPVVDENHFISEDKQAAVNDVLKLNGLRSNFANMKVDEKSNSSSGSSRNQSPVLTPAATPHGPGRGGGNNNVANAPPPPVHPEHTTPPHMNGLPPPPPTAFVAAACDNQPSYSSSVPSYSNFQSVLPQPARTLNCCNCGGIGHMSYECSEQSVESMMVPHYVLEYDPSVLPDYMAEK